MDVSRLCCYCRPNSKKYYRKLYCLERVSRSAYLSSMYECGENEVKQTHCVVGNFEKMFVNWVIFLRIANPNGLKNFRSWLSWSHFFLLRKFSTMQSVYTKWDCLNMCVVLFV